MDDLMSAEFMKVVELLHCFQHCLSFLSLQSYAAVFLQLVCSHCALIVYTQPFPLRFLVSRISFSHPVVSLLWSNQRQGWLKFNPSSLKHPGGSSHSGGKIVYCQGRVLLWMFFYLFFYF